MAAEPITVHYVPEGEDWTVNVSAGETVLTDQAPGLIAARDRADQLVEELSGTEQRRTVVHLLEGDAFAFTTAYLQARHGMTSMLYADPRQEQAAPLPGENTQELDLSELTDEEVNQSAPST
ncbi:hypothetical protein GCM10010174_54070 [Kutzneria viridogrisea]|uniref:Uncharacterized protein n=2 Tax=Kutzneria TaxID=43356 RepID=W5W1K5_9PSEU|nr:hypothetical protein [Kutzneria albida]AHH94645.1 hypothetical protein KALB_1272 [Kutzneria albida DSM 43870]MBA8930313.1 hypothetical protein [Kutzneria viridogrisea]